MGEIVVGGVPSPIGGVTTFVRRYSCNRDNAVKKIIDFYPGKKDPLPLHCQDKHKVVSGVVGLVLWFLFSRHSCSEKHVFFNFSTPRACLIFLALPKRRCEQWSLMLHHGKLSLESSFQKILIKSAIKKIDKIRHISENQKIFYKSLGVSDKNLAIDTSYCPPLDHVDDNAALKKILELRRTFQSLTLISGFPTKLYNIRKAIEAFMTMNAEDDALCIFIYGPGELREEFHYLTKNADNIIIFDGFNETYFNTFLKNSDLFLRLTEVESVGIAVWDANFWRVKILASDVCPRPESSHLVNLGSQELNLEKTIRQLLK